jgi:hypothetical protein
MIGSICLMYRVIQQAAAAVEHAAAVAGAAVVVAQMAGVTKGNGGRGDSGSGRDAKDRGRYGNIKTNNYFGFTICQKSIKGDLQLLLRVILEDD